MGDYVKMGLRALGLVPWDEFNYPVMEVHLIYLDHEFRVL
jgi:hypothetical protein